MITRDGSESHLTAVCPDGSQKQRLTSDAFDDYQPALSPDRSQIAFLSDRSSGTMQVHLMDTESGSIRQITADLEGADDLVWLPEGDRIAVRAKTGDETWGWMVVDLDSGEVQPMPGWVRDSSFQPAAFSHDGKRLVYLSSSDQAGRTSPGKELRIRNRDGSGDSALTPGLWDYRSPVWSLDDRQIAFLSDQDSPGEQFAVYVVDVDGGSLQQVTHPMFGRAMSLAWSPDGQQLAVNDDQSLYVMALHNGEMKKLFSLEAPDLMGRLTW